MVESRIQPIGSVMALLAGLREVRGDMIRIGRALVVLQVAAHARGGGDVVVVIHVTVGTLPRRHGVQARQRKTGGVVIESCVQPRGCVVTLLASLREV